MQPVLDADVDRNESLTDSQRTIGGAIMRQVSECATFVNSYMRKLHRKFVICLTYYVSLPLTRITPNILVGAILKDYNSLVNGYISALEHMQQQFKLGAIIAIQLVVHQILDVASTSGNNLILLFDNRLSIPLSLQKDHSIYIHFKSPLALGSIPRRHA